MAFRPEYESVFRMLPKLHPETAQLSDLEKENESRCSVFCRSGGEARHRKRESVSIFRIGADFLFFGGIMKEKQVTTQYGRRFAILTVAFFAVFFGSFVIGRYGVPLGTVLRIFAARLAETVSFGALQPQAVWTGAEESVVLNIRLPRVICAALVGAALSAAGAAYQGMFRNPMVSPDLLGASTGAGFGAALAILLSFGYFGITVAAFAFGIAAVLLACLVSRFSRLSSSLSMVLAGVMIGSLFSSCTSFVKLVADTEQQLPAITYWLMGSLSSAKNTDVWFAAVPILLGLVPLLLLRWRINLLTISEAEARSLGINTRRLRTAVILCATLITAASVAVSGMIGWVGLVIPHFCRMMFGYDYRRIMPASVLMGGTFLMVVDDIARIVSTSEIPLGILTSFVGAPVFIYLILEGGADREH